METISISYGFTIYAPSKLVEHPKNSDKTKEDFLNFDNLCLTLTNSNGCRHKPSLNEVLIYMFEILHKAHLSNKDRFLILKIIEDFPNSIFI